MLNAEAAELSASRARQFIAALVVLLLVAAVWKVIDYRTQPPAPPHAVGAQPNP